MKRLLMITVSCYAGLVVCLWQGVNVLADRVWPATLVAFGPRWPAALPLVPLALVSLLWVRGRWAHIITALLTTTGVILVFGFMDYRTVDGRCVDEGRGFGLSALSGRRLARSGTLDSARQFFAPGFGICSRGLTMDAVDRDADVDVLTAALWDP